MNGTFKLVAPLVAALTIAACNGGSSNMPGTTGMTGTSGQSVVSHSHPMPQWQAQGLAHAACPQVIGRPTCLALISDRVSPACVGATCGWSPIDFQTRYNLPITKGSGNIVAIVDAGDNPNAATDIAEYRTEYGLGTAKFFKYNQDRPTEQLPKLHGLVGRDRSRHRDGLCRLSALHDLSR